MAGTALLSTVTALPLTGAALPLTPSTIQSIVVPLSVQTIPSVAGSSGMPLISMPPVTQAAEPLINMPHAAMQPAAMPLSATPSIMSTRPNQMGYFTGAPSAFNTQSTQFPYMSNPFGKFHRGSKCYKISSFKSGNSLRLRKLSMLNLKYLRCRLHQLFHRGLLSLRRLR